MSLKDTLFNKVFTIRNLFVAGNFILFGLFVAVVVKDQIREWKPLQKEYFQREIKRLHGELEKASSEEDKDRLTRELSNFKGQSVRIRQVMLPKLNRYDRCLTCHTAMDSSVNPAQTTSYESQPFAAKDNAIHKAHPVEKFGCTVCHGGQDLGTTVKGAHGEVHHWEKPLLRGAYLQASCAKCHTNVWDEKAMPYTDVWRQGESLFKEKGCIGCHQVKGWGGPISVDLAEETADKPLSRIDFSHTGLPKEEWTLANWIKLHFVKDPATLVPGDPEGHSGEPVAPSGMPWFGDPSLPHPVNEADADALATYVLSMAKDSVPVEMVRVAAPRPEPAFRTAVEHGKFVYQKYGCAACHAPDAKGGIRNHNYENDVEPNLTKTAGTFTREELKHKIQDGVPVVGKKDPKGPTPPLYMPAWKDKIKGQELEDLVTYLLSIAEKQEEW
jgi:mono/diheme cytochrome c family protein/nitrate reductase cytochrome c-type subunit